MLTEASLSAMAMAAALPVGPDAPPPRTWVVTWAVPMVGLAIMAAWAVLRLRAATRVLAPGQVPPDSWAEALNRKESAVCVATFAVLGVLCGGLALAAWLAQGQVAACGLSAVGVAFLCAAQITAGRALRR